jgi:uncharacterized membrane protein (UPF0127 family)
MMPVRFNQSAGPSLLVAGMLLPILILGIEACAFKAEGYKTVRKDGTLEFVDPQGELRISIAVEIADTVEAHIKGLQGRESLNAGEGMLFVFSEADDQEFWMRNTLIPLDIIFVAESGQIINIAKCTEPLTDKRHASKGPAKYVVEVPSGFTDRHGITEDFFIRWERRSE